ncbi:MAG TPA: hypothetical protein DIS59_01085 [Candidatus Magasanikbacteria bacterium]|nr:hypothetical protein [Candidatus Magasanikbacteria bacterium]
MNIQQAFKSIGTLSKNTGIDVYVVGGFVRDQLLERDFKKDLDVVVLGSGLEFAKQFAAQFSAENGRLIEFSDFDTARYVFLETTNSIAENGEQEKQYRTLLEVEFAGARKEAYRSDSRKPTVVPATLEEDLSRRDFTVNAMALGDGLVDPFGGQNDIKNKIIRAVGNPSQRFKEDALRLIRAVRISGELEFEIEPITFEAIKNNAGLLLEIADERVRDEMFKILSSVNPYYGIAKLRDSGLLPKILPELEQCFGISQEGPKHDRVYDIGKHSLLTLKETPSADPLVRLGALLHDIGKTKTVKIAEDGNVTFYNHDLEGGKMVLLIARRFNLSKKQTDKLYRLVRWHLFTVDENQTDAAVRRFIKNVGLENIEDIMALRIGDRLGGGTQKAVSWRMEKFKERIKKVLKKPFSISDLKVDGNDVMKILNIKPGPKVGEILKKLFAEVLDDAVKNDREYLLKRVNDYHTPGV